MIGSKYFAGKYFSSRLMGGIPQQEIIVIPPPAQTGTGGGGYVMGYKGWADTLKNLPTRKRKDMEMVGILAMFTIMEDEENGSII